MPRDAIDCYINILKTEKTNISTIGILTNQIGVCYSNINEHELAIQYFKKVLKIKELSDVYYNIGICYIKLQSYDNAKISLLKAYQIEANYKTCINLGKIYYYIKQYDKSIEYYNKCVPNDYHLLYNLSFSYLSKKDFKTGFELYDNRLTFNNLNSQTGLQDRLEIPLEYWNGKDYKLYIMSLPKILNLTTIVPNQINYIKTNEDKLSFWKDKTSQMKYKVGFVYNGLLSSFIEKNIPLEEFETLCDLDINLICIHRKSEIEKDISRIHFSDKITYYDIDTEQPFEDTICLLQNLDLLITIDTFIVHLAGILNIKTWLLLGTSEWRWSNDQHKTYWYETVELIRTSQDQKLKDILSNVKPKLQNLITNI